MSLVGSIRRIPPDYPDAWVRRIESGQLAIQHLGFRAKGATGEGHDNRSALGLARTPDREQADRYGEPPVRHRHAHEEEDENRYAAGQDSSEGILARPGRSR
jgi:hypothetical protein